MPYEARYIEERCLNCGSCSEIVACPGAGEEICIGCGACVPACPNEAIQLVKAGREKYIGIEVNGELRRVPERISIREALEETGYKVATCLPDGAEVYAPCDVGACWNCAVVIDGEIERSCITMVKDGMRIRTDLPQDWIPLRLVGQVAPHSVGGVGTPWEVRESNTNYFLEIACLVCGCNFRCPQCQNWLITFRGKGTPNTPGKTAARLTFFDNEFKLGRFCLSGGEITLNRVWLVQLLEELRKLNPEAHLHISTNGSLLTRDYIDELVDAGLTDIGIDLKALHTDTFMKTTGLQDKEVAQRCKENAWKAVDYICHRYHEKVFIGVGVPYNKDLTSLEEIRDMGRELCNIDPSIQTTALTYRPAYRSRIMMPELDEMKAVHRILKEAGLTKTIRHTYAGFFGPDEI